MANVCNFWVRFAASEWIAQIGLPDDQLTGERAYGALALLEVLSRHWDDATLQEALLLWRHGLRDPEDGLGWSEARVQALQDGHRAHMARAYPDDLTLELFYQRLARLGLPVWPSS
jgi:hypothetical protein